MLDARRSTLDARRLDGSMLDGSMLDARRSTLDGSTARRSSLDGDGDGDGDGDARSGRILARASWTARRIRWACRVDDGEARR
jgi:hypothetical protein